MTPSIARTQLTADYSIPKIINGGWQLATGHALAHALDMKDAHNAFAELLDRGFDTFDCADIYTGILILSSSPRKGGNSTSHRPQERRT